MPSTPDSKGTTPEQPQSIEEVINGHAENPAEHSGATEPAAPATPAGSSEPVIETEAQRQARMAELRSELRGMKDNVEGLQIKAGMAIANNQEDKAKGLLAEQEAAKHQIKERVDEQMANPQFVSTPGKGPSQLGSLAEVAGLNSKVEAAYDKARNEKDQDKQQDLWQIHNDLKQRRDDVRQRMEERQGDVRANMATSEQLPKSVAEMTPEELEQEFGRRREADVRADLALQNWAESKSAFARMKDGLLFNQKNWKRSQAADAIEELGRNVLYNADEKTPEEVVREYADLHELNEVLDEKDGEGRRLLLDAVRARSSYGRQRAERTREEEQRLRAGLSPDADAAAQFAVDVESAKKLASFIEDEGNQRNAIRQRFLDEKRGPDARPMKYLKAAWGKWSSMGEAGKYATSIGLGLSIWTGATLLTGGAFAVSTAAIRAGRIAATRFLGVKTGKAAGAKAGQWYENRNIGKLEEKEAQLSQEVQEHAFELAQNKEKEYSLGHMDYLISSMIAKQAEQNAAREKFVRGKNTAQLLGGIAAGVAVGGATLGLTTYAHSIEAYLGSGGLRIDDHVAPKGTVPNEVTPETQGTPMREPFSPSRAKWFPEPDQATKPGAPPEASPSPTPAPSPSPEVAQNPSVQATPQEPFSPSRSKWFPEPEQPKPAVSATPESSPSPAPSPETHGVEPQPQPAPSPTPAGSPAAAPDTAGAPQGTAPAEAPVGVRPAHEVPGTDQSGAKTAPADTQPAAPEKPATAPADQPTTPDQTGGTKLSNAERLDQGKGFEVGKGGSIWKGVQEQVKHYIGSPDAKPDDFGVKMTQDQLDTLHDHINAKALTPEDTKLLDKILASTINKNNMMSMGIRHPGEVVLWKPGPGGGTIEFQDGTGAADAHALYDMKTGKPVSLEHLPQDAPKGGVVDAPNKPAAPVDQTPGGKSAITPDHPGARPAADQVIGNKPAGTQGLPTEAIEPTKNIEPGQEWMTGLTDAQVKRAMPLFDEFKRSTGIDIDAKYGPGDLNTGDLYMYVPADSPRAVSLSMQTPDGLKSVTVTPELAHIRGSITPTNAELEGNVSNFIKGRIAAKGSSVLVEPKPENPVVTTAPKPSPNLVNLKAPTGVPQDIKIHLGNSIPKPPTNP